MRNSAHMWYRSYAAVKPGTSGVPDPAFASGKAPSTAIKNSDGSTCHNSLHPICCIDCTPTPFDQQKYDTCCKRKHDQGGGTCDCGGSNPSAIPYQGPGGTVEFQQGALQQASKTDPDADCNSWGLAKGLCVAGKSVTKGGSSIGTSISSVFKNPITMIAIAGGAFFLIFMMMRR